MPVRLVTDPHLPGLLTDQYDVIPRDQALKAGLTRRAIDHRLAHRHWQRLLPGIYLTRPGDTSRRQLLMAAQLYSGPRSAIDGPDACR